MSKPLKIKLSIPEPCKEDWGKMMPDGKGRFCEHCKNLIMDFTDFTDRELVKFLSKEKGIHCGRFNKMQLNRVIVANEPANTPVFRRLLFGTALAAGVASTAHSQGIGTPNEGGANSSGFVYKPQNNETKKPVIKDTTTIFKGQVIDSKTKQGIPDAEIILELDSINFSVASTDSNGFFSANVPSVYLNKQVPVYIHCSRYDNLQKLRTVKMPPKNLLFKLTRDEAMEDKVVGRFM